MHSAHERCVRHDNRCEMICGVSGGRRRARNLRASHSRTEDRLKRRRCPQRADLREVKGDQELRRAGERMDAALHAAASRTGTAVLMARRRLRACHRCASRTEADKRRAADRHRQRQQQGLQRDHISGGQRDEGAGTAGLTHGRHFRRTTRQRPIAKRPCATAPPSNRHEDHARLADHGQRSTVAVPAGGPRGEIPPRPRRRAPGLGRTAAG